MASPAALTELRFLYKTFSQQQDLPYRVVHENITSLDAKSLGRALATTSLKTELGRPAKQLRFIQRYAIVVCIVHDSSPASNYCLPLERAACSE